MRRTFLQTALAALAVTGTALAGSFNSSFTSPTPAGFVLNGNAATRPDGSTFEPVIQDGHLILTYGENSQQGTIVLDDLDAGAAVESFVARFKLQIGPGSGNPADGLAFSFGPEVDASANFGEEGLGTGIIVSFDIYDNGGGEAPAIDVKYNGVVLASAKFAKADLVTGAFEDVEIQLTRSGVISVSHKGKKVHDNIFIPGFAPITGLFAIGARTGGENANHWLDDLSVTTVKATPVAPTITTQPASKTVTEGQPVTFTAGFDGSAPFTLQWLSNNVAIADATNTSYTIDRVALAANGAKYKLAVSNAVAGVTSAEAVLTVTPLSKPLTLLYATGTRTFTGVRVWFSSPLDPVTAATAANYKLSGGLTVTSAKLAGAVGSSSDSMVDLVTSAQTPGQAYTLTVSGVKDQTSVGNTVTNGSTAQFSAWTLVQGALLFEHWSGLSGVGDADIDNALADPRVVANDPTTIGLATRFDTRTVFPDDSHENYLARLSGWITPTETADYYFFLRADDGARLYLSANETLPNPAVDTPIANEPGCCGVFFEPDSGDPATTPAPISLVAGKRYGVMALLKEGGGGDYLMVAWRKSTDTTPAADLPYLPGQFLSTYVDPNVDLVVTKQPVDQPGVVASAGIEIFARDFNANDGGFTVTNTEPPPPGPWIYDAAKGLWAADGSEDGCTGPYNSQLNSAPYKLTQDGAVSLSFSHRYSFEGGLYDAGQVRISVNGGPFTLVPAGNFTANGYAEGAILGTGLAKGLRAFNDDSPGFVDGKFITSKALLGTFRKDDTLVVQFLGAWDECSAGRHPSWEIDSLNLVLLPMIIKDFVASNGGFTVENTTPPPAGPWTYDSTNGVWFANGSDDGCTGPYNTKLNSTPFVAPESDEVTLTFTHRYSFESGFYDGGQVRLSVNGGPFTTVAADRFTANGYADSPIVGTGILNGQKGFNGDSAGFASSNLITSSAVLGTFTKGDSLVVQFVGAWDECSGQLRPSWLIKNVQLAFGKAAKASTFETAATAGRQGKVIPFTYQWQRDDGTGFINIAGANAATFRIFPVATDFAARFRAVLTVPGKTVITSVVKLTEASVEVPTITIAKSGAGVVVTYTGTLQSAPVVSGPYQNVSNAQSPYTVPAPAAGIFFRSVK